MSRQLHSLILALIVTAFFLSQRLSVDPQFQFYGSEDVLMTSGLGIYFSIRRTFHALALKLTQFPMHKGQHVIM